MAAPSRNETYQEIVKQYLENGKGHVLCLSSDQGFLTHLRLMITKDLGITDTDVITSIIDPLQAMKAVVEITRRCQSPVIFMEQTIRGQDMSMTATQIKQAFPSVRLIFITADTQKERLMLLIEAGADSFIIKPVSTNTILEKLGRAITPMTALGKALEHTRRLFEQGKYEEAQATCQKILAAKPGNPTALLLLGRICQAMKDYAGARNAYEQAAQSSDEFLAPIQHLVDLFTETGQTEEQISYLEKLDNLSPLNISRKVMLGEIYMARGEAEKADGMFSVAMDQATKEAMDHLSDISSRIAGLYADSGDPAKAEKVLRDTIAAKGNFLSRKDLFLFNKLGISLRRQGRWMDAIHEYRRASRLAPDDESIFYNLGMAYAEGEDFIQGKANMLKALEINPQLPMSSPGIAFNIGIIFLKSKDSKRAVELFKAALAQDPDNDMYAKHLKIAEGGTN
ncbi:MAG: tetratricopeptide repeat protein [Desulfovibrionaceae bacterium]|nr:tetratricopeptide repeat protein [Desulfovibrionaceae bacterium]